MKNSEIIDPDQCTQALRLVSQLNRYFFEMLILFAHLTSNNIEWFRNQC